MSGSTRLLAAKNVIKQIHPLKGCPGTIAISTPKKRDNDISEAGAPIRNEKVEPIAAFSKPPPFPSFLGPFLVYSFLEMISSRDGKDE